MVSLLQLPHHGPILECLFLIFLGSTLNPWAAHFKCADFFPLVADKSRVGPICSNFVVLCIDGNIPKRLTPCALGSPVSTMVEPLLSTHALAGAEKTGSSELHYACKGTWFVPGSNISQYMGNALSVSLSATFPHNLHRTSNSPSPLCRAS